MLMLQTLDSELLFKVESWPNLFLNTKYFSCYHQLYSICHLLHLRKQSVCKVSLTRRTGEPGGGRALANTEAELL